LGQRTLQNLVSVYLNYKQPNHSQEISHHLPARCHELTGKQTGQFSVDLEHPYRLLFIPAENPVPWLKDGGIDRSKVREIEIIDVKDTHK